MSVDLDKRRQQASEQSLGGSHQSIYDKALQLVSRFTLPGRHLDFGSGKGQFIEVLMRNFNDMKVVGVDLMKRPADLSQEVDWVICDLNHDLPFEDKSFDSVTALEIIEHLENPRHLFRELYRVLKPEGHLILSTPNNESWRSLLSYFRRGHFVAFTESSYPAHITPLNRQDLARAAAEAGFSVVKWDFSGEGAVPGMTQLLWQKLSFGVLDGLRYCDNIFVVLKK